MNNEPSASFARPTPATSRRAAACAVEGVGTQCRGEALQMNNEPSASFARLATNY